MNERIDLKYEDFIKICRLCCKSSMNMSPIFQNTEDDTNFLTDDTGADSDTIAVMLLKIGLSVQRMDGLPQTLCSDCYAKLLNSNIFREQCFSSDVYLQDILVRHKEYEQVKSVSTVGDIKNFDGVFQIDYLNKVDSTDVLANSRVEALDRTMQTGNATEICSTNKRKRGRPKLEKPPPLKQNRSVKSSGTCKIAKIAASKKKKSDRKDICLTCGKIVNHNIKGHQAIHDKSETFVCDICGFESNVKLYMKNHMKKIHVAQRQYPCSHCHLVFMHAVTLKRHTTIHTGEKNYVCEECGKSYRQRDMLTAHRKRHLPPTIQCSFCDKLFYSKNELKSHTGLHTGIKAFKCDICSAAFVASSSLAAHRRQHKKDNVLPLCKLCGMMFSDRLVYNMHLMDHKRKNQSIEYNNRQ